MQRVNHRSNSSLHRSSRERVLGRQAMAPVLDARQSRMLPNSAERTRESDRSRNF
jgi:hypothetical protein